MTDKRTRVEFIESYWKDGNTDYIWNDNHGELIRCKDCKHWDNHDGGERCLNKIAYLSWAKPNDFCSYGERKDSNNDK